MKTARYVRVSSERQVRNTSIPNQLERTAAYVANKGWDLDPDLTFVEPGESGANLDRPALNECRSAARARRYDALVIYDLDRFNRNLRDLLNLRHEFQQLSIPVYSICDNLEMTSCDEATFIQVVLRGVFSQVERDKISRRMREGREKTARNGKYVGGLVPYGYLRNDDGYLVIDEEPAGVVRLIFHWATEEKMSGRAIARRLNAMGTLSPKARLGKTTVRRTDGVRHTPEWTPVTVRYIIHGETYVGRWTYHASTDDITISVPAIVDEGTWKDAQATLVRNRRYSRPPQHHYLLRGLIRCKCGAAYCGRPPRRPGGPHGYRCIARYDWVRIKAQRCIGGITIPGPELEEAIWTDVEKFIRQPHLVAAELARRREPAGIAIIGRLANVDRVIAERQTELDRYLTLYGRGTIPIEQLDEKAEETRGSLATLKAYRANLIEEQQRADLWEREMAGVLEALTTLRQRLDENIAWEDKRAVVEALVKQIVVETHTDDNAQPYPVIHVTYKFERPDLTRAPIPIELEPVFLATNWQNQESALPTSSPSPFELEKTKQLR